MVKCGKCGSGCYCSDICRSNHHLEHRTLCSAIVDLEKLEKEKLSQRNSKSVNGSNLSYKLNRDIVRLVGERPVINVLLDGVDCKCLWDTGSMVSLINEDFLKENGLGNTMHTVQDFMENKLNLSAANNTEVN